MQKRGVSQVDWAVSLAIFILFVAWFFIFIQPNLDFGYNKEILASIVTRNFQKDHSWSLQRVPVFVFFDGNRTDQRIVFNFTRGFTSFTVADGHDYFYDADRITMIENLTLSPAVYWLYNGSNYTRTTRFYDLITTSRWATTSKNFSVNFEDSMVGVVKYGGSQRFADTAFFVNGEAYEPEDATYNDTRIIASYYAYTQTLNHTTVIYSRNSMIDIFLRQNIRNSNLTYRGEITLLNYSDFYSDNIDYGYLNYSRERSNYNFSGFYITFYDSDAVSFMFEDNTSFDIDYYNDTIEFSFEFRFVNSSYFSAQFHKGTYENFTEAHYDVKQGVVEDITGLSLERLDNFSYADCKRRWNYPSEREFSITVWNHSYAASLNETMPLYFFGPNTTRHIPTIFSKDVSTFYLTDDMVRHPVTVNIKVW